MGHGSFALFFALNFGIVVITSALHVIFFAGLETAGCGGAASNTPALAPSPENLSGVRGRGSFARELVWSTRAATGNRHLWPLPYVAYKMHVHPPSIQV